jgi:hypothetical protein
MVLWKVHDQAGTWKHMPALFCDGIKAEGKTGKRDKEGCMDCCVRAEPEKLKAVDNRMHNRFARYSLWCFGPKHKKKNARVVVTQAFSTGGA